MKGDLTALFLSCASPAAIQRPMASIQEKPKSQRFSPTVADVSLLNLCTILPHASFFPRGFKNEYPHHHVRLWRVIA